MAGQMRFPGLSKDPLNAFRRLRADLARFSTPFLNGKGIKAFEQFTEAEKDSSVPTRHA